MHSVYSFSPAVSFILLSAHLVTASVQPALDLIPRLVSIPINLLNDLHALTTPSNTLLGGLSDARVILDLLRAPFPSHNQNREPGLVTELRPLETAVFDPIRPRVIVRRRVDHHKPRGGVALDICLGDEAAGSRRNNDGREGNGEEADLLVQFGGRELDVALLLLLLLLGLRGSLSSA